MTTTGIWQPTLTIGRPRPQPPDRLGLPSTGLTLREFARLTGWPLDELLALPAAEFADLLALYGLRVAWVLVSVDRRAKALTYEDRIVETEP